MSHSESQPVVSSDSPSVSYVERFENERLEWTERVRGIASRFKNVEDLVDVQVDLYSERQRATDYVSQLYITQSKLKKAHLAEWKKAYDALTVNHDFHYNDREKAKMADEKTSATKLKLDIVQTHIDFFRETVKTVDNMIFGVKHRLEIEDFRRGNK